MISSGDGHAVSTRARAGLATIDPRDVIDRAPSRWDRAHRRTARVMAELAALTATLLAVVAAVPQLRRVLVAGDAAGVSLTSSMLGVSTELAWVAYASASGLWSALPEAVAMSLADAALAIGVLRRGAPAAGATVAAVGWLVVLLAAATLGGLTALAVLLAGAYAVQVAPAIWTVWRTPSPTGVAAATWSLIGVEGALWCVYGLHHGDPAIISFGIIAMVAAAATLARKATTARVPTIPDEPQVPGPELSTISRITVP